jgi:hypothetical protein
VSRLVKVKSLCQSIHYLKLHFFNFRQKTESGHYFFQIVYVRMLKRKREKERGEREREGKRVREREKERKRDVQTFSIEIMNGLVGRGFKR